MAIGTIDRWARRGFRSGLSMTGGGGMALFCKALLLVQLLLYALPGAQPGAFAAVGAETVAPQWTRLLVDADKLRLPTQFLKEIPPDFVRFEFEDLHAYAAEYHPEEHRLVLNRSLSFNGAGRTLGPLTGMTNKELQVLYHELFHAYMDYLVDRERDRGSDGPVHPVLAFARKQQACRYSTVMIAPLPQKPDETETRYLSDEEAWEALNETWAVFVGWAIWQQLEVQKRGTASMFDKKRPAEQWMRRYEQAVHAGEWRGYYVPQDQEERRLTHKRFLGNPSQISGEETLVLMSQVIGFPKSFMDRIKGRPGLADFFSPKNECTAAGSDQEKSELGHLPS